GRSAVSPPGGYCFHLDACRFRHLRLSYGRQRRACEAGDDRLGEQDMLADQSSALWAYRPACHGRPRRFRRYHHRHRPRTCCGRTARACQYHPDDRFGLRDDMSAAPRVWIGTSWKMNKTLAEASSYAEALRAADAERDPAIQRFVIPPITAAREVKALLAGT